MRRLAYYACVGASTSVFVALVILCVRSHFRRDALAWRTIGSTSRRVITLASHGGVIDFEHQYIQFSDSASPQLVRQYDSRKEGLHYSSDRNRHADWIGDMNPFSVTWDGRHRFAGWADHSDVTVGIDYGLPLAMSAALPAWWLGGIRRRRRQRRISSGHCANCNFDLHSLTSSRCPECGASVVLRSGGGGKNGGSGQKRGKGAES
jgi:predicted RNA-binding Zn-ribbon protein involved in translation (DUF1610 family)